MEHRPGSRTIRVIEPFHYHDPVFEALVDDPRLVAPMRGLIGTERYVETRIFLRDEDWRAEAEILAFQLGFLPGDITIEPLAEGPRISGLADANVVVYLGAQGLPTE